MLLEGNGGSSSTSAPRSNRENLRGVKVASQVLGVLGVLLGVAYIAVVALPGGRFESLFDRLTFPRTPERTARQRQNRRRSPRAVIAWGVVLMALGAFLFLTAR